MAKKNNISAVKDVDKILKNLNIIATQMEELVNLSRSQTWKDRGTFWTTRGDGSQDNRIGDKDHQENPEKIINK